MSRYRYLTGPTEFMGVQLFQVHELDDAGTMRPGSGETPQEAMAALETGMVGGGDWRAAPGLARAVGLPPERVGSPNEAQRQSMLISALFVSKTYATWPFRNHDWVEATLAGLSLLARRSDGLPTGLSFPYRAEISGSREGQFHAAFSRDGDTVLLVVTLSEATLREIYELAMGGEAPPDRPDFAAATIDLGPSWMADAMQVAFGVGFSPNLYQRVSGEREAVTDLTALMLGIIAAACPDQPESGRGSRSDMSVPDETITCRLDPLVL